MLQHAEQQLIKMHSEHDVCLSSQFRLHATESCYFICTCCTMQLRCLQAPRWCTQARTPSLDNHRLQGLEVGTNLCKGCFQEAQPRCRRLCAQLLLCVFRGRGACLLQWWLWISFKHHIPPSCRRFLWTVAKQITPHIHGTQSSWQGPRA